MKIIAVMGQKGGAGKSTISCNLASMFSKKYKKVALLDVDPQGTTTKWFNRREARVKNNKLAFIPLDINNISNTLKKLEEKGCEVVVIDTLPTIADYSYEIADIANMVIIPCKASLADAETINKTLSLFSNNNTPFVFVLNEVKQRTLVLLRAKEMLSKLGAIVGSISSSVEIDEAFTEGQGIVENNPSHTCSRQYKEVFSCLVNHLNKTFKNVA